MITGNDLIAAGWQPGPGFGKALDTAIAFYRQEMRAEYTTEEIAKTKALILLGAPPTVPELIGMRSRQVSIALAIKPEGQLEESNLAACMKTMDEVRQHPMVEKTALMPDACPAGPGVCVGGVVMTRNAVIPAMHSADMCCSMNVSFFVPPIGKSIAQLMGTLENVTHFGIGGRERNDQVDFRPYLAGWKQLFDGDNPFLQGLESRAREFLGTCGDGNHFNYLGKIKITPGMLETLGKTQHFNMAAKLRQILGYEVLALVTHFGSRGVGAEVFKRGAKVARQETEKIAKGIPSWGHWIPKSSERYQQYWEAVAFIQRWTHRNHNAVRDRFLQVLYPGDTPRPLAEMFNAHNFVWKWKDIEGGTGDDLIYHGKGATPAWQDETYGFPLLGAIPLNMAEPILLVLGEANREFLCMAPHGAGRNMSRTQLLNQALAGVKVPDWYKVLGGGLTPEAALKAFRADAATKMAADQVKGLDIRWFSGKTDLSETPMAYKSAAAVKQQIKDFALATVWGEIEPLGCIMAGEGAEPPWKTKKAAK